MGVDRSSLILKTIKAFPRGRTTEEILVLVGAGFSHNKRVAAIAELDELLRDNLVKKEIDGRWRAGSLRGSKSLDHSMAFNSSSFVTEKGQIIAAAANFLRFRSAAPDTFEDDDTAFEDIDPQALLRYWRSVLRADPRGATTQVEDKHGIEWALISGHGPVLSNDDEHLRVTIDLDALPPAFREALIRREGNENALALGWPMSVGRRGGVPIFQPVGLLAASWIREGGSLVITADTNDILINPDWLSSAARLSGWNKDVLSNLFDVEDGVGLPTSEFIDKLRDAVASQIRGSLDGVDLASELDVSRQGIFDSAAIFLPTGSSFTSGAARDLDQIAAWPNERLACTALASVFGLKAPNASFDFQSINIGLLNGEQTHAVIHSCLEPLTVVTGPPGTGKSQAIVSMAASVFLSGGSVLVASKNHQALDAVEDRLGKLAPNCNFVTRTLKPEHDIDIGFADALKMIVNRDHPTRPTEVDNTLLRRLMDVAKRRSETIAALRVRDDTHSKIADLIERIEFRDRFASEEIPSTKSDIVKISWFKRLLAVLKTIFSRKAVASVVGAESSVASVKDLQKRLEVLRSEITLSPQVDDPISLGEQVRELAQKILPDVMAQRTHLTEVQRQFIAELYDDWTFAGGKGKLPSDLAQAVVQHRPLWLASVLGAPRRIPLEDGLFDLVIFDEASQCDIATAIPLLARSKRAVVVGDDKQLSFIPQLGQAQDRNLMQAQGLPVPRMGRFAQSRRSLFDFATRVPDVARVTLRHQYRSAGPIVEYISENFYGGQLATSYDPTTMIVPAGHNPGISWENVPAPSMPQNGNVNPAEVAAIVRHLKILLVDQEYQGSIGVISPFRAQVLALEEAVRSAIPEPRRIAAELKVGTVDGFQGQERDLILFSPCVGLRSPQSGITFFQRDARRLNVAI